MNERIRVLAEQAGIAVWGDAVYMYDPKNTLDSTVMEKFAELIVRECAKIADDGFASSNFGNGITGHQLLKHFGVEE